MTPHRSVAGETEQRALSPDIGQAADDRPSIAVFSYTNAGDSNADPYFSEGITDDIVLELSRYRELLVICRGWRPDAGEVPASRDLARQLGVKYGLHGSIRRMGDRLRITSALVDVSTGDQLWADRQDGLIGDLLDIQTTIASRVAASIAPEIEKLEQRRAERRPIHDVAAYDLALRAGALIERGLAPADADLLSQAIRLAQQAVALDPSCQRAHYALAWGYCRRGVIGGIRKERWADLEAANAAALRLRALDPGDYSAYAILGHLQMRRLRHQEAIENLRRAHELNPSHLTTLRWLSWEESNLGLVDDARHHGELALRVGPRDRAIDLSYWVLALAAFVAGDREACLREARRAMALNPQFSGHKIILAACLAESGRLSEAAEIVRALAEAEPELLHSRLSGQTYFAVPELAARYVGALRLAAEAASDKAKGAAPSRGSDPLSGREKQILGLVAQGLSNPRIAVELGLSEHTVKRHVANILLKLALPTRAAAVAEAARLGILAPA